MIKWVPVRLVLIHSPFSFKPFALLLFFIAYISSGDRKKMYSCRPGKGRGKPRRRDQDLRSDLFWKIWVMWVLIILPNVCHISNKVSYQVSSKKSREKNILILTYQFLQLVVVKLVQKFYLVTRGKKLPTINVLPWHQLLQCQFVFMMDEFSEKGRLTQSDKVKTMHHRNNTSSSNVQFKSNL